MSQRHRLLEKATSGVPSFDSEKLSYQSGQVGIAVLEVTDPDPVLKVAEEPSCVEIGSWGVEAQEWRLVLDPCHRLFKSCNALEPTLLTRPHSHNPTQLC